MACLQTSFTNVFRLIAGMACAMMLLVGHQASAGIDLPVGPGQDFIHPASSFKFAPQVGSFHRTGAHQYDEAGLDVSVGYRQDEHHIIITAYVYACKLRKDGTDLEKEFNDCEAGIRAQHEGVKTIEAGPVKLVQGERTFNGRKGVYSVEHFSSTGKQAVTQLYLFVYKNNFIEFRITHPPGDEESDEAAIAVFLKTLTWP